MHDSNATSPCVKDNKKTMTTIAGNIKEERNNEKEKAPDLSTTKGNR